eukprot:CAMPEP_0201555682 /NCGR_PEP_ID=MMETSP0173_2-20130828/50584_1 /ASSEMBLY_ACC=CAM_ASM_000268 /TAXON_ID=218659 /ORGANISM="Vexillifera sp., Strain DIVA3 564/2" /LENGTH=351 /DNA_ID=CAMNT_0047967591 /DNA_START=133 /DNA_END=1188 /DNA_ORIENTATION=-
MGLLLGDIEKTKKGDIVHVWGVVVLERSDKQTDRVEISPEQLAAATCEAETVGQLLGRNTRIVGWYHSHPRITVWPSHVDLRTQYMYQQFDSGFVGLIFSCFHQTRDNARLGSAKVIAFQSMDAKQAEKERKAAEEAEKKRLEALKPKESVKEIQLSSGEIPAGPFSTLTLEMSVQVNPSSSESHARPSRLFSAYGFSDTAAAMAASETTAADHEIFNVPLQISNDLPKPLNLQKIVQLQELLFQEERAAYRDTLKAAHNNPIASLHHSAVYQKALCRTLEFGIAPLIQAFASQYAQNQRKIEKLKKQRKGGSKKSSHSKLSTPKSSSKRSRSKSPDKRRRKGSSGKKTTS